MPVVIFFACLDLEQKSSFLDGHYRSFRSTILNRKEIHHPFLSPCLGESSSELGIERIPHAIPQHVEPHNGEKNACARHQREPGGP